MDRENQDNQIHLLGFEIEQELISAEQAKVGPISQSEMDIPCDRIQMQILGSGHGPNFALLRYLVTLHLLH